MFEFGMVQIAGISNTEEAKMLESLGVVYLGFPLFLDYHREDCPPEEVKKTIAALAKSTIPVLITYLDQPQEIIDLCRFLDVSVVQLHAEMQCQELKSLKKNAPQIEIIKSLIIGKDDRCLYQKVKQLEPFVDVFLTDTFDPETGASGATGKTHNWSLSGELAASLNKPLILAGGLNPSNIQDAIAEVKPHGVDSHTGVENESGMKDPDKVSLFLKKAEEAFSRL